jgi:transposase
MEVVYARCCGLDVHKRMLAACILLRGPSGEGQQEIRRFGTRTRDLLELVDWLHSQQVTHVAMESTGVYWKPSWNILEGEFAAVLVNAQHIKAVPGRKTETKDCQWMAELLQHGRLRSSFVPPPPIRQLRDLTRLRTRLGQDHTAVANRRQKILEDAHIKLASVASDWLGVSGRAILAQLLAGEEAATKLAHLSRRRLRAKLPQRQLALEGRMTDHHRWLLRVLWDQLEFLEAQLTKVDTQIHEHGQEYQEAISLCPPTPGLEEGAAANLLAEIGANMDQFPSAQHFASWAGICPGNHESAGKRLSGPPRKGSAWLRRSLCQAAWAASHTKDTCLAARFRRLAARQGKKRAIVAVGHTILVILYHVLKTKRP